MDASAPELVTLATEDGEHLEAEIVVAPDAGAIAVLCHPHPQFGGDMRSLVVSELFRAYPAAGISCLRFNFRGVGASSGTWDDGGAEQLDVRSAVEAAAVRSGQPVVLVGWSFGADLALTNRDPVVVAWVAIAPPLHFGDDHDATGRDARPKLVMLAEHDEFRPPEQVIARTTTWQSSTTEVIGGASHFFVGRTGQLVTRTTEWINQLPEVRTGTARPT